MFGKLIKNEFKGTVHTLGYIYLVALVTVGVMALSYIAKITWISGVATVALIATGAIAIVVTFFMVIVHFNKSLYGNQGYLSFTLPVTSNQLLAAKTIVSFCWMLLSYAVAIGIFIGVYLYATAMVGDDVKAAAKMLLTLFEGIPNKSTIIKIVVIFAIILFIKMVKLIAQLYFSVTLSNTRVMQKLGGFSIVIVFFALFILLTIASMWLTNNVPFSLVVTGDGIYYSTTQSMSESSLFTFGLTGIIFDIIASIALFAGTSILMDSKINLK